MDLSWEKWLVMAALAIISIFLGMIPLILFHGKWKILPAVSSRATAGSLAYNVILTVLACFGGGVLLATAIVHMLTEAREDLFRVPIVADNFESDFPASEILSLIGFALIYLVEEVAHFIMVDHEHHPVIRHNSSIHSNSSLTGSYRKTSCNTDDVKNIKAAAESTFEESTKKDRISQTLRSLLALIALSFHAIMEGIAIGIQESASLWFMFGAVASHKFVISFCMGMELFATRAKLSTYVGSIIFFGIISPVGIFIGTLISSSDSNALPIAIIKGLSTGTLIYVVFFEILNRERTKKETGLFQHWTRFIGFIQFASICVGIAGMIVLITVAGHDHSHEHVEEDSATESQSNPHKLRMMIASSNILKNLVV